LESNVRATALDFDGLEARPRNAYQANVETAFTPSTRTNGSFFSSRARHAGVGVCPLDLRRRGRHA